MLQFPNEDLRLTYRYYDLRRPADVAAICVCGISVTKATRDYLDSQGFFEIETPILSKSTPEGARDFLVPSRLTPGKFYALPQAPQQYKQLLMVAGWKNIFKSPTAFATKICARTGSRNSPRSTSKRRSSTPRTSFALTEGMLARDFQGRARTSTSKCRSSALTYREALSRYGSDKPDRRFGMELVDLGENFRASSFKVFRGALDAGGVVKAINAKGFAGITIGQIDELTEMAKTCRRQRARLHQGRKRRMEIADREILQRRGESRAAIKAQDRGRRSAFFFAADKWDIACEVLGRLRLRVAEMQKLDCQLGEQLDFLWVTDFPLLAMERRRKTNGTRCIIRSRGRKPRTCRCSKRRNSPRFAPRPTTSF